MMAFDLHAALLLVLAFALGGLVAFLVRRRAQRRGLSALAQATLLSLDDDAGEPDEPRRPVPPAHDPVPEDSIPLAPLEPQLPLDLPMSPATGKPKRPARLRPASEALSAGDDGTPADTSVSRAARPPVLAAPEGDADDLKRLKGVGPQNERRLNALGIYHLRQIAAWTPEEVRWVGATLAFPGRIEREHWVEQAKALLDGQEPAA